MSAPQLTQLLNLPAIGAASGGSPWTPQGPFETSLTEFFSLSLYANFVFDSGGTSVDAWVQTTLDGGLTWFDIANFHFTGASGKAAFNLRKDVSVTTQQTAFGNHSLTANTSLDGFLGDQLQVLYQTVGTYGGASSLVVWALPR